MIWIVLTIMIGAAAFFAAAPFLFPSTGEHSDSHTRFYQRQLAEIDADAARGSISDDEAAALRLEAQRRLLKSADNKSPESTSMLSPRITAALTISAFVIAGGTTLYFLKGSPGAPSSPAIKEASQLSLPAANAEPALGTVDSMIDGLKAKLDKDPSNADGWRMLGWSYFNLGRNREAQDAYAKAVALAPDNAGYQSSYGETIVATAGGFVTPEALKAFDTALASNPADPRSRFFKGLALDQSGDSKGAIEAWIAMVNSAPADADWKGDLVKRIRDRASETGFDLAGRLNSEAAAPTLASTSPMPTTEQVRAAMTMPEGDRQAMIENMVNGLAQRLAASPNDPDGWIRLIRSRTVLGQSGQAQADLKTALNAFSNDPSTRARIQSEAAALGVSIN
ncbi:MAG: c-type cytochrome biogenesis protein CcmI [Parvularculaceae bacterium]